jgi:sugar phosphate isomerase/epimerase
VNTGRWGTIKSFDELMAQRGVEPTPEGRTDEEAFAWVIDSLRQLLAKAEECGVTLALENHWGLSRTPEAILRIVREIDSPWLRVLMDTGNFLEDPYDALEKIAPESVYVQTCSRRTSLIHPQLGERRRKPISSRGGCRCGLWRR